MTVTYDSASNQLWVESDFIDDIIGGETGYTTEIDVTINGGDTETLTITLGTIDVPNTRYEIDPSDIGLTEFSNGIYAFKLSKINNTNGNTEYESYCLLVDITFTCEVIENISSILSDTDEVIYIIGVFNLLKNIHQCEECACSNGLALWNEINYKLGLETKNNDCGCN